MGVDQDDRDVAIATLAYLVCLAIIVWSIVGFYLIFR